MHRKAILLVVIFFSFIASYFVKELVCEFKGNRSHGIAAIKIQGTKHDTDIKIVSMAPSITETLFALGLGGQVVGVTRYCDYPPRALRKPIIGGYHEIYYEALAAAIPDISILFYDHGATTQLEQLGYRTLQVNHKSISGILSSIADIGTACGAKEKAISLLDDLKVRMARVQQKTKGLKPVRVMISVGRNMGSRTIQDAYITGRNVFHDEMIEIAGGENVYKGSIGFPAVSKEGIIHMNPEVIIEMIPDMDKQGLDKKSILKEWRSMTTVDAVVNGRVHIIGGDYAVRPGPRFILVLEEMARILHPEVDWR